MEQGQTYPPPYYQDEQWNAIDAEGWVRRNLTTHRDADGNILQQAASVGTKSVNFTMGETFEISPYRLSFDFFVQDLDFALSHPGPTPQRARGDPGSAGAGGESVTREETSCEDGSACLLITIINPVGGRRVWINMQTGQQVQFQPFQRLADGTEQAQFTQRFVLVERVTSPPQEVLDILERVASSAP
jgi:hypothetical protein